jgi:methyl-CpG-binding domain protein 4
MSRVSSLDTKHKCISAFFALYPTPSAFLIETDWSRVKDAIHSLGLFDDRLKSLIALTTRFLNAPVFNVSPDPKSEDKIRGIGAFGYESYLVFCRDEGASIKLSDGGRPLVPFVAWRKRIAKTCE